MLHTITSERDLLCPGRRGGGENRPTRTPPKPLERPDYFAAPRGIVARLAIMRMMQDPEVYAPQAEANFSVLILVA